MGEGELGAVELGLDLAGVAEEIAEGVVVGIGGEGLQGEGETGVGIFGKGLLGGVALAVKVVDDLLEEEFLEADFDLLGTQDAPGVGGELGDEELLVGALGGEVLGEAGLEGLELGGVFKGEDGELGGEAVLEGVEAGFGFAGRGAGAGGLLRILLTCGALSVGEGSRHGSRVAWGLGTGRVWG